MIKSKKIIVETKDEFKTLQADWTTEDVEKMHTFFGRDLETEMYSLLFDEITKCLVKDQIKISDLQSIRFEEV
jgi:hypothetical protein